MGLRKSLNVEVVASLSFLPVLYPADKKPSDLNKHSKILNSQWGISGHLNASQARL